MANRVLFHGSRRSLRVQNNSTTNPVPSCGLVRAIGADPTNLITVDVPNADSQPDLLSLSVIPINAGATGTASRDSPCMLAYDPTSGTPTVGSAWGSRAGSYLLTAGQTGWTILGRPNLATKRVLAQRTSAVPSNKIGVQHDGADGGSAPNLNFQDGTYGDTSGNVVFTVLDEPTQFRETILANYAPPTASGCQALVTTGYPSQVPNWSAVTLSGVNYDTDSYFNPTTPTQLTLPAAGYYTVGASLVAHVSTGYAIQMQVGTPIGYGGVSGLYAAQSSGAATAYGGFAWNVWMNCSSILYLPAGGPVCMQVTTDDPSGLTYYATHQLSFLYAYRMR